MINSITIRDAAKDMTAAMLSGDESKVVEAWETFGKASAHKAMEALKADYAMYQKTQDKAILAKRGIRQLTSQEEKFYNGMLQALKSSNPKQAFVELTDETEGAMPSSILEDVFRDIAVKHELLDKIDVQNVQYLTKWVLGGDFGQAAWGKITAEIEAEIEASIEVVDIKQNKLSCFAILELGMVDLGPQWLDSYIRAVLGEALAKGLEEGIINGTGDNQPLGMVYNVDGTAKEATELADLAPATVGNLIGRLTTKAGGGTRELVDKPIFIVNPSDYWSKVYPAITVLTATGEYRVAGAGYEVDFVTSQAVESGKAIIGIGKNYFLGVGQSRRNNVIEYSDEYKFIDDQRAFKIVTYADGRAVDDNSFILLNISGLEAAALPVKEITTA